MDKMFQSVAICKYKLKGEYKFEVYDKHVEKDEVKRFDRMLGFADGIRKIGGEVLWVKVLPLMEVDSQ